MQTQDSLEPEDDIIFNLKPSDLDQFSNSNMDSLTIIQTLKKQNQEYLQELLNLRSDRDKSRDRDSTYRPIDTHKLYEALVSVLEITPEIKENDNAYSGSWVTANKYKMDDSIHALIEELDKRYKQLD